jgi:uncharacterized protein YjdB
MAKQGRLGLVWFALATVLLLLVTGCKGFFVDPSLTSIAVTPLTPTITPCPAPAGSVCTVQMTATGTFSDGSTSTVAASWSSSDTTIATVGSSTGLVSGVGAGTATITAAAGTVTGSTSVTVALSGLQSIVLNPAGSQSFSLGTGSHQFTATGNFSGGGSQDITNAVTWHSSDTTVATVSNTTGSKGLVTFVKAGGPINITATSGSISSLATSLTVTP